MSTATQPDLSFNLIMLSKHANSKDIEIITDK